MILSMSDNTTLDTLVALAQRIKDAGRAGRGVRLTAEETHLLLSYNLPATAESPDVAYGD
jgi:hypothetical protein